MAKETGKRWRDLSHEERVNTLEAPAVERLEKHREKLEHYEKTEEYRNYQMYLEEFKQQQHHSESVGPSDNNSSSVQKVADAIQQPISLERLEATHQKKIYMEFQDLRSQSPEIASLIQDGMDEVRSISNDLGVNTHSIAAFPSESMTSKSVKTFLDGTGSLLYLWEQEEAEHLMKSVYRPQHDYKPIDAAEVFAMAAIGSYCDAEAHMPIIQEKFLHFFLYMLYFPSNMCDLRYMRLLICLAVCRFTSNVDSARRLMFGLLTVPLTNRELPRKISPVGELGRLAAYIAFDLKTATQPKSAQASVHFESLNHWHHNLPPPMQLSRLSLADPLHLNWSTKRALLQLHILFLGLLVEPFRNCLINVARLRLGEAAPTDSENVDSLFFAEDQCILAARQSARVISLLQTDNLIRSHCWVSIYTSFTACSVLLLSASQKLLQLRGEAASQELSYATPHLSALSFCSYDNSVAKKLCGPLQIIFNDIREITVSPVYRELRKKNDVIEDSALKPHVHYDGIEDAEKVIHAIWGTTRSCIGILREASVFQGQ
ncbi:hypothetical protein BKA63DRAFT_225024 [Paraphoma chrysanthemicola]|nr:hypothetical protein BKA63DRAFT_225024 [Paraphoma chrysanthemicola]